MSTSHSLVIAEKPSVAQSIAAVIGATEKKDGYLQGNGYLVSWCYGHLVELARADAYDEKFKKWRHGDLPIIPADWKYTATADKRRQLKILGDLMNMNGVSTIICATDAGREGELIFRLVYNFCYCTKRIQRLWISSMEESAIAQGFENLKDGTEYENLYQAALCRSKSDWLVGINATRLFSVLYNDTLNVGRVQSPTLAMLVSRSQDIKNFVKEPFYTVELDCGMFKSSSEKMKDKNLAQSIQTACNAKNATIKSVERQEKSAACPKLYDLTTLQREANRLFGYTAQQTLDYVQSLYEKKLATYPRTDSRYLTEDMADSLPGLIDAVAQKLPFGNTFAAPHNIKHTINNAKVSDHHAIIPTASMPNADIAALPTGEKNILYMLAVRLISATHDKHTYAETKIILECEGYEFAVKGKTVLDDGWKAVEKAFRSSLKEKTKDKTETPLPEVDENQVLSNVKTQLREGFTSPPKDYTEDTILSAMETAGAQDMPEDAERKGLGTPATRAGIIEKLIKTGFVERQKRSLTPTQKGINLIGILPEEIKSPLLTAEWEEKLKLVERGELPADTFLDEITAMTTALIQNNGSPDPEKAQLFADSRKERMTVGTCPRCGGAILEGKKGFFCESKNCAFNLWKENKYFSSKKKMLTRRIATALLKEGRVFISDLYSEKTGRTYDAYILLDDTGGKYVNFKMEFPKNKRRRKSY
ncbi:MAG: DNA topoisomerase 3 [Lachnospiraceae bacterium]